MFDSLSDRLNTTLTDLRSRGRLSEEDVAAAMREIRLALLEADVNFKVVREFVAKVRERAVGEGVLTGLNPGQQVIKIVNEELAALMGTGAAKLAFRSSPSVILMARPAGLRQDDDQRQAREAARQAGPQARPGGVRRVPAGRHRAAEDRRRRRSACRCSTAAPTSTRSRSPTWGVQQARQQGRDTVIVDTAGRLHVDDELMASWCASATRSSPTRRCSCSTR